MSRFATTILLAVLLLGILLWIVLSTVAQLANPQPLVELQSSVEAPVLDPALPVIVQATELREWLNNQGMDGPDLLNLLHEWRVARGYPTTGNWLDDSVEMVGDQDTGLPDDAASLLTLAGNGDIAALQMLAERSLRSNPVEALDWYDQAIVNGSLYAMLRVSDLLLALGDPQLTNFTSGPVWQQALSEINAQQPAPSIRALAWAIAAINVGGYAIVDPAQANRINELSQRLDANQIRLACETAQDYVLTTATARRALGGAVFSTERPLFAVSIAAPEKVNPCDVPVPPLVNMTQCRTGQFVGPGRRLWQVWFCSSP